MPVALPVREFPDPALPPQSSRAGQGVVQRPARRRRHLRVLPPPTPAPATTPSRLLSLLTMAQRGSMVAATTVVGLALLSYGVSVSLDRQIKASSSRLSQIQKSQQQLTSINEVLKHHFARQAQTSGTALIPPSPQSVIFLPPADVPPVAEPSPSADAPSSQPLRPLGY